jgi:hypothetical protein
MSGPQRGRRIGGARASDRAAAGRRDRRQPPALLEAPLGAVTPAALHASPPVAVHLTGDEPRGIEPQAHAPAPEAGCPRTAHLSPPLPTPPWPGRHGGRPARAAPRPAVEPAAGDPGAAPAAQGIAPTAPPSSRRRRAPREAPCNP